METYPIRLMQKLCSPSLKIQVKMWWKKFNLFLFFEIWWFVSLERKIGDEILFIIFIRVCFQIFDVGGPMIIHKKT